MSINKQVHQFDQATKLSFEDGIFTGETSAAYANMVGPFGGATAAQLLQAAMSHPDCEGEPISITVNYAAAIKDGEFTIKAIPSRTNRSTQHWTLYLIQDEVIIITGSAVFASRRKTWSATDIEMPQVPKFEDVPSLSMPLPLDWVNNYDIRIIKGIPDIFSENSKENDDSTTIQWIKDNPDRPLDALSLVSMSDAFFPRIFVRRNKSVPISTITLTTHFHADQETFNHYGSRPILGHARGLRFHNGFFDQTGEMWSEDGRLLASTTQMAYYRD